MAEGGNSNLVVQGEADETDEELDESDTETESVTKVDATTETTQPSAHKLTTFNHWKLRDSNATLKRDVQRKHEEYCKEVGSKMTKINDMLFACQKSAVTVSQNTRDSKQNILKSTKLLREIFDFAGEAIPKVNIPEHQL